MPSRAPRPPAYAATASRKCCSSPKPPACTSCSIERREQRRKPRTARLSCFHALQKLAKLAVSISALRRNYLRSLSGTHLAPTSGHRPLPHTCCRYAIQRGLLNWRTIVLGCEACGPAKLDADFGFALGPPEQWVEHPFPVAAVRDHVSPCHRHRGMPAGNEMHAFDLSPLHGPARLEEARERRWQCGGAADAVAVDDKPFELRHPAAHQQKHQHGEKRQELPVIEQVRECQVRRQRPGDRDRNGKYQCHAKQEEGLRPGAECGPFARKDEFARRPGMLARPDFRLVRGNLAGCGKVNVTAGLLTLSAPLQGES